MQFRKGERKDDVMAEHLSRFAREEGVVFVGKAQEKTPVFRTEKRTQPDDRPALPVDRALQRHGEPLLRLCGGSRLRPVLPQVLQLLPVQRQAVPERPRVRQAAAGQGGHRLRGARQRHPELRRSRSGCRRICDGLSAAKIDALLRKWLRLLPHPFTGADRRAGYRYDLSILQAEFSLTQVLDKPQHGRLFFEQVIRENLDLGRPEQVQLIFKRRVQRNTPGRFRTRILTQDVTPSLHVYYKNTRIKQYHKEGRALRTETTINNAHDFGVGKRLCNLPDAARDRLCGQPPPPRGRTPQPRLRARRSTPSRPSTARSRQGANAPPACALPMPASARCWQALILFRQLPDGFRSADLRHNLAALSARSPQAISHGAATYQLRRLRLHGLIERVPQQLPLSRHQLGLRAALFFTRVYNRLLRPGLAAALPDLRAVKPRSSAPSTNLMPRSTHGSTTPNSLSKLDTLATSAPTEAKLEMQIAHGGADSARPMSGVLGRAASLRAEMAPVPTGPHRAVTSLLSPCHPHKSSHLPEEISFWLSRASKHFRS